MKPFKMELDGWNKDIQLGMDREDARDYYLNEVWGSFESRFSAPVIEPYGDKYILRADLTAGGLKSFGGERVIAESPYSTMVYCAPRQGHAPDSIAMISKVYDKECIFFMPSSKEVSDHQGALFAYDHCKFKFFRIAAMPNLNKYAKEWADKNNSQFLPFGLTGNKMVTAGLVNACNNIRQQLGTDPSEIHCAVSTGTMIRALQIGWPKATPCGTAVARNIHPGEVGDALMESATIPFLNKVKTRNHLPFPTTGAYDAKAWDRFVEHGKPGAIFINVGSDEHLNRNLASIDRSKIDSFREWHDMRDLDMIVDTSGKRYTPGSDNYIESDELKEVVNG